MNRLVSAASICLLAPLPGIALCQTVCLGEGGKPCTPEESKQMQEQICKVEDSPPNLSISSPVKLTGVLFDETTAPIVFENTFVQIKAPQTNAVLYSAQLNSKGQFDLGLIPAGQFRLIAVLLKDGKPARLPTADQPKALSCSNGNECRLKITIHFHGTDNPVDLCPPK